MRNTIPPQLQLGEVSIVDIVIDTRSRDDIPQLLRGLQHLYTTESVRDEIFVLLEGLMPDDTSTEHGRPGMSLWNIFVMGMLRLNLNCDFDRLLELVNQHKTIRQMLGHGLADDDQMYSLQTVKDNIQQFTPEVLDKINQIVVREGQSLKKNTELSARCDSFVLETDVHFPTDISLLYDAMRKIIKLTADYAGNHNIVGWRQYQYHIKKIKRACRKAQQLKRSSSKNEAKKHDREILIQQAHQDYIGQSLDLIIKSEATLSLKVETPHIVDCTLALEIKGYIAHAQRQIDQIQRRVLKGEKIPHNEKVFSIFEPHTEWISKGKAGVAVELGLKVCIVEDSQGYILHHRVMQNETDNQIAISIIKETKQRYPELSACSFDKGFHSPENQIELAKIIDDVVLPKKGKCNKQEQTRESDPEFKISKRKHSAVESGINALEVHGLDICRDRGIKGFKRYVAMAIVARNIQKMGSQILRDILKKEDAQRLSEAA